jgi:hypothetical protein
LIDDKKFTTYFFTLLGSIFIGIALLSFNDTRIFLEKSIVTQGKIVEIVEEYSAEDGVSYQPKVEFETKEKTKIRFVSEIRNSFSFDQVNSSVEVIYNPASPQEAKINKFSTVWFMTILFGSMGLIFIIAPRFAGKAETSPDDQPQS